MTSEKRKAQLQVIREKLNNSNLSLLESALKLVKNILILSTNERKRKGAPDEKELGFLKRLSSLIPNMLTTAKQGEEQLKQVKNLSEEDKQKLLELGQKEQEN
ncbi:14600_t:CDS:2 [Entrophospora sp. SA101]|nr:3234_t:CDS:2 [Entrophospora sp. SA101]CAJ0843132.1 14600_t:CDS:2 [Entrophospora sp. SA101]